MKIGKIDSTSIQIKNNKIANCQSNPAAYNLDNKNIWRIIYCIKVLELRLKE